jgi:cytochrome c5
MSNPKDTTQQELDHDHSSLIKTPKQLIITVVLSFILPIIFIIMLVSWVTSGTRKAPGSQTFGPEATAMRIAPVAKLVIIDSNAPKVLKTGEQAYNSACMGCHAAGVAGAHKFGDQVAWAVPIGTGLDVMVANVVKGKGAMPAKGGNPTLDNLEIARAVVYMTNAAGGQFAEPTAPAVSAEAPKVAAPAPVKPMVAVAPPAAPVAMASATTASAATPVAASANTAPSAAELALGQKIYNQACVACHAAGVAGSPKFGDKVAWGKYLDQGIDGMTAAAIKGVGIMPARGGLSTASDADIHAAVQYIVTNLK